MRKGMITGLAVFMLLNCAACGSKETAAELVDTEVVASEEDNGAEAAASAWTAEGNFVDDADNHMQIYHMLVENGYDEDGWSVMVVFGESIYGGEMDEQDGMLTGVIGTYEDDGTPGPEMEASLTVEDGQILLRTGDGKEYYFRQDDTDYSEAFSRESLPFFQYNQIYGTNGFDAVEAAAYDYLAFKAERDYDPAHVMLPYVHVVEMDESDPGDVLLYGDYYLWEFEKDGDILVAVSGGHRPGIIHAERFGEGETAIYSALSME
ncbi:MAG: hypothetical protein IJ711_05220, partial [Lachnospiraceae bacterium]|nr:hypothetical protein [Lachnospiraceae bacterium]